MPNKKTTTDAGVITYTITEDETINLGDAARHHVGTWVIYISGGGTYSIVPKKKLLGSTLADASAPNTHWLNHATGEAETAGTAITSATLFTIDASGCAALLAVDWTSGACTIECRPVVG
jgi:hypothetical protein